MVEAIGALAALGVAIWLLGGIALRILGAVVVFGGIVNATQGEGWGLGVMLSGGVLWLAGHWHFALRHRYWKSPLAESIARRLPLVPNPAAGWGVPGVDTGRARAPVARDAR